MDKQQSSSNREHKSIGPKSAFKKETLRKIKEKAYIKRKVQDKLEKYVQVEMSKSTRRIEALEDLLNGYLSSRRDSIITNPQTEFAIQKYIDENSRKNVYQRKVKNNNQLTMSTLK